MNKIVFPKNKTSRIVSTLVMKGVVCNPIGTLDGDNCLISEDEGVLMRTSKSSDINSVIAYFIKDFKREEFIKLLNELGYKPSKPIEELIPDVKTSIFDNQ